MNVKASREVLDYSGRRWMEFAEVQATHPGPDFTGIVREVVETGDFEKSIAEIGHPAVTDWDIDNATRFSAGRRFLHTNQLMYGMVKMIATDFLPIGVQYVVQTGERPVRRWIKTDVDLVSETKQR